jgi:putative flippase GtrA
MSFRKFVYENIPSWRYVGAGFVSFTIELSVLNFLMYTTGLYAGMAYSGYRIAGYIVGHSVRFLLNRFYVYESKNSIRQEMQRYAGMVSIGIVIGTLVSVVCVSGVRIFFGFSGAAWANGFALLGDLVSSAWDLFCNNHFVFAPYENERLRNYPHTRTAKF